MKLSSGNNGMPSFLYRTKIMSFKIPDAFRLLCILTFMATPYAHALEQGKVEIHGFLTAGLSFSDADEVYLDDTSKDISFEEDTVFGLQFGTAISDDIKVETQILAGGVNANSGTAARVDWAFVTYEAMTNLS
ncbi:MAG: hypothetical protein OEZ23_05375, partial [Gammaproteobacteria bacterium]|nr:hypothetical protein [Gammaproteobacteria bacterium]